MFCARFLSTYCLLARRANQVLIFWSNPLLVDVPNQQASARGREEEEKQNSGSAAWTMSRSIDVGVVGCWGAFIVSRRKLSLHTETCQVVRNGAAATRGPDE